MGNEARWPLRSGGALEYHAQPCGATRADSENTGSVSCRLNPEENLSLIKKPHKPKGQR